MLAVPDIRAGRREGDEMMRCQHCGGNLLAEREADWRLRPGWEVRCMLCGREANPQPQNLDHNVQPMFVRMGRRNR